MSHGYRGTREFVTPILVEIGLPAALADALDDESLDAEIRAETGQHARAPAAAGAGGQRGPGRCTAGLARRQPPTKEVTGPTGIDSLEDL